MLARYLLTGAGNTAFSYGIYCAALYLGAGYPIAALISLVAGVCLSFVTMGRIVFRSQLRGRFPGFVTLWACLYLVHVGLIRIFVGLDLDPYTAGLVASIPVLGISFLGQRYIVFNAVKDSDLGDIASLNKDGGENTNSR